VNNRAKNGREMGVFISLLVLCNDATWKFVREVELRWEGLASLVSLTVDVQIRFDRPPGGVVDNGMDTGANFASLRRAGGRD